MHELFRMIGKSATVGSGGEQLPPTTHRSFAAAAAATRLSLINWKLQKTLLV